MDELDLFLDIRAKLTSTTEKFGSTLIQLTEGAKAELLPEAIKLSFQLQAIARNIDPENDYHLEFTEFSERNVLHVAKGLIDSTRPLRNKISLERKQRVLNEKLDSLKQEALATIPGATAIAKDADFIALAPPQKKQIQDQLNALRDLIAGADEVADEQRERLLGKVNELQTELNKDISSYHKNLGRMVDLADALGESGKRMKPLVDRAKELMDSLKIFKKENAQIGKEEAPLQIPDLSDETEEE